MAKQFERIEPAIATFIERQHIFFTASAATTGRVNVSPRGADAFRVVDPNTVAYLDETGSGNETAAHLRASGRLTIMFCSFEGPPMILRLYGHGGTLPVGSSDYETLLQSAFDNQAPPGARQIVRLTVDLVQTSCGYGVPLFDYRTERPTLRRWAEAKGPEGIAAYRREKNVRSIDGFPTGVPAAEDALVEGTPAADMPAAVGPMADMPGAAAPMEEASSRKATFGNAPVGNAPARKAPFASATPGKPTPGKPTPGKATAARATSTRAIPGKATYGKAAAAEASAGATPTTEAAPGAVPTGEAMRGNTPAGQPPPADRAGRDSPASDAQAEGALAG